MFIESLGLMILNWLRIPPGTSVRKNYGVTNSDPNAEESKITELVQVIVDITRDDICFGNSPVFVQNTEMPDDLTEKVRKIVNALNSVIRWACFDVLTIGYSVYKAHKTDDERIVFLPVLQPVEFYLNLNMEVTLVVDGHVVNTEDFLIFLNYEKQSLELVSDNLKFGDVSLKSYYKINPVPVQLKNARGAMDAVSATENSILAYRKQLAKIVRFASVDVGVSQGDQKDAVIDSISSALNANSTSLNYGGNTLDFDDSIPIIPHRNGLGKPELSTDIPSADINNLADLDYDLNKLYLSLRFPKSYADFSQSLGGSVVSTLRGDIRYNRMVEYTRTLLIATMNNYLKKNLTLSKYDDILSMAMLPTPEDDDVLASLDTASRYAGSVTDYIFAEDTKEGCMTRLTSLRDLLGGMSSFDFLTTFFDDMEELINTKFPDEDETPTDFEPGESSPVGGGIGGTGGGIRGGGPDFGEDTGGPDFGEVDEPTTETPEETGGADIEFFPPT